MRKWILAALLPLFIGTTACSSTRSVSINGNEITLNDGMYAKFETTEGDVLIQLYYDQTPMTVGNFVSLAEGTNTLTQVKMTEPFYDGLIFHRVIPDFMIQGGDPMGTGAGDPGYKFPDEIVDSLTHDGPGILSMANSGPGTNGSQFFITHKETPWLNGRHTIFGKVIEGQEIVTQIGNVEKGANDKPATDVILTHVTIVRVGKDAVAFDAMAALQAGIDAEKAAKDAEIQAQEALLSNYKADATTTESGLMYIVKEQGSGEKPELGQTVQMHYAGYFLDGKIFDTSIVEVAKKEGVYNPQREPYAPLEVELGPGAPVIQGWKEALSIMSVGDKYTLIIPPHLGWGPRGSGGVIPPNAWTVFEVEMVGIKK